MAEKQIKILKQTIFGGDPELFIKKIGNNNIYGHIYIKKERIDEG